MEDQVFKVIRKSQAPSIDGNSTIHYELGKIENRFAFRIEKSSGGAKVNNNPVLLSGISNSLKNAILIQPLGFGSKVFKDNFNGLRKKNRNNAPFLAAILRHEGLIEKRHSKDKYKIERSLKPTINYRSFPHRLVIKIENFESHIEDNLELASGELYIDDIT
ncbi:MAG: hypothetical protein RPS47_17950 [Colwellia sp.]|jgi:hypothetical protein